MHTPPRDPPATVEHAPLHEALTHWWTPALRVQALKGLAISVLLPWALGELAKLGLQPGLSNDAQRQQALVDYMVLGGMLFAVTMWLTWLIGCWIVDVMKGRPVTGDAFPEGTHRPSPADDLPLRARRGPRP